MKQLVLAMTLLTYPFAVSGIAYADEQNDKQAIIVANRTIDGVQVKDINQAFSAYAPELTQVELDGKIRNLAQISQGKQTNNPSKNQVGQNRDYLEIYFLASDTINRCYKTYQSYQEKLKACDTLVEIETTLTRWCSQGDSNACTLLSNVLNRESIVRVTSYLSQ